DVAIGSRHHIRALLAPVFNLVFVLLLVASQLRDGDIRGAENDLVAAFNLRVRITENYPAFADNQLGGVFRHNVQAIETLSHNREVRVWGADSDVQLQSIGARRFDNSSAA